MVELKKISPAAVPSALDLAKRYRMLNEPHEAESICLDILEVDPENQDALITMLLALTDNFSDELNPSFTKAQQVVTQLHDDYCKAYYSGILFERRAKTHLRRGGPGSGQVAYHWFAKALEAYHTAMSSCDPDNQDAVLRWNSCARIVNTNEDVKPDENEAGEGLLDSFETPH
jgi:hypothetical protein